MSAFSRSSRPQSRPASKGKGPAKALPPIRVRCEPPTLDEAVAAAQGLADDPAQQVAIAAGLMGVAEDEVRPHVLRAPRPSRVRSTHQDQIVTRGNRMAGVVVVERMVRRPVSLQRAQDGGTRR